MGIICREEIAVNLVRLGHLSFDACGQFYRHRRFRSSGKVFELPVPQVIGWQNWCGYRQIRVHHQGKAFNLCVHRVIWVYYHGPIPEGLEINHKNGDKSDNRMENLELVTHRENLLHAHHVTNVYEGRLCVGEKSSTAKLTWKDVQEIRRLWASGLANQPMLSDRYGVSQATISMIVNGKTWIK